MKNNLTTCRTNRCGHWGTDQHNRRGCLRLPVVEPGMCPSRIGERLLLGHHGCLADPPLFGPIQDADGG